LPPRGLLFALLPDGLLRSRFFRCFLFLPNAGNGNVIQRASKPNGRKKRLAFKKVAIQQRIGTISSSVNRKLQSCRQEKLKSNGE